MVFDLAENDAYLGEICLLVGFVEILPQCRGKGLLELLDSRLKRLERSDAVGDVQGLPRSEIFALGVHDFCNLYRCSVCYSHYFLPVKLSIE